MRKLTIALIAALLIGSAMLLAQSPADVAAQADALKALLASYGSSVSSAERTDFGKKVDALKAAILQLQAPPVVQPPDTWKSEFWTNSGAGAAPPFPTTAPTLTRIDASLDFDWGNGPPATGISQSNFIARFTRTETLPAGDYVFSLSCDDGCVLMVDGQMAINQWRDTSVVTYTWAKTWTAAGLHAFEVRYYDNCCNAVVKLSRTVTAPGPPVSTCAVLLTPVTLSAPATATDLTVNVAVAAGCAWSAAVTAGDGDWFVTNVTGGTGPGILAAHINANPLTTARTSALTVTSTAGAVSVPLTQAAPTSTPPPPPPPPPPSTATVVSASSQLMLAQDASAPAIAETAVVRYEVLITSESNGVQTVKNLGRPVMSTTSCALDGKGSASPCAVVTAWTASEFAALQPGLYHANLRLVTATASYVGPNSNPFRVP